MNIVVIDDDADIRDVIGSALQLDGHDVSCAMDGVAGLDTILTTKPDLVICDIDMPRMTGVEVIDSVRGIDGEVSATPFIILSGKINENDQVVHLNNGVEGCFRKPISLNLLRAQVNSILSSKSRINNLFRYKLDLIAASLRNSVDRDFGSFVFLRDTLDNYVNTLCRVIETRAGRGYSSKTELMGQDQMVLKFIDLWLEAYIRIDQMLGNRSMGRPNWQLIFVVAQADFSKKDIYVSDLYVALEEAKTTINSRVNILIDCGVFDKSKLLSDGRRQRIRLTEEFRKKFRAHAEVTCDQIKQLVG